jgi:hypothetical protein
VADGAADNWTYLSSDALGDSPPTSGGRSSAHCAHSGNRHGGSSGR